MELYRKYRPTLLKDLVGQDSAVATIKGFLKTGNIPHAILLSGPSGVGKTTVARILREKLECLDNDYFEVNGAQDRGIEMVREIADRAGYFPSAGSKCRVWCIDEAQAIAPFAQHSALKLLEDPPETAYFILCTSDRTKLYATIRTRCTEIRFQSISNEHLEAIILTIVKKEGKNKLDTEIVNRIVEAAQGSARKAVVYLESVLSQETRAEQMDVLMKESSEKKAIDLCRLLMKPRTKAYWKDIAKLLRETSDDPEIVRKSVLGYASAMLLNCVPDSEKYYHIVVVFESNFYDSGKAGLVRACYECSKKM